MRLAIEVRGVGLYDGVPLEKVYGVGVDVRADEREIVEC
jgi:hypothetical protein